MKSLEMTKEEILAAELYNYNYDNYADHIEVENERFTRLMPETVRKYPAFHSNRFHRCSYTTHTTQA